MTAPAIVVEFYGMARRRAGRATLEVRATTVGEALASVARECGALAGLAAQGSLSNDYLVSLNAGPFLKDLNAVLAPGDRMLLLSADAGG